LLLLLLLLLRRSTPFLLHFAKQKHNNIQRNKEKLALS